MSIISALYRGGLGTNVGRMAVGGAIGGIMGFGSGDQYTSTNSRVNRAAMGMLGGVAAGAGFNILTSSAVTGGMGRLANAGAARMAGVPGRLGRSGMNWAKSTMGDTARAYKAGGFRGVGEMGQASLSSSVNRLGAAGTVGMIGLGAAGIGGAALMAANTVQDRRRQNRVSRFQASTGGIVQGMHQSRHNG